jgi:hypothetical protein
VRRVFAGAEGGWGADVEVFAGAGVRAFVGAFGVGTVLFPAEKLIVANSP